jgi:hypothetical protein
MNNNSIVLNEIISKISLLDEYNKVKLFEFFESERKEYYDNKILEEVELTYNDYKIGKIEPKNVNAFLNSL